MTSEENSDCNTSVDLVMVAIDNWPSNHGEFLFRERCPRCRWSDPIGSWDWNIGRLGWLLRIGAQLTGIVSDGTCGVTPVSASEKKTISVVKTRFEAKSWESIQYQASR